MADWAIIVTTEIFSRDAVPSTLLPPSQPGAQPQSDQALLLHLAEGGGGGGGELPAGQPAQEEVRGGPQSSRGAESAGAATGLEMSDSRTGE